MRINTKRYEIGSRHWCVGSRNVASSHKLYIICSEWVASLPLSSVLMSALCMFCDAVCGWSSQRVFLVSTK